MAASTVTKHLYDGQIDLEDGTTPGAVSLTAPFTVGDLSLTGLQETQNNVVAYETRGTLNSVRHSSRTYPSVSFSLHLADLSDGTDQTVVDFLLKQASFSANVSTFGANAEVYAIQVTLTIEGTDWGDTADHTIVMADFVPTSVDIAEGEPNTVSVSGTVYGSITMT